MKLREWNFGIQQPAELIYKLILSLINRSLGFA
jgi:hypothetical protein